MFLDEGLELIYYRIVVGFDPDEQTQVIFVDIFRVVF